MRFDDQTVSGEPSAAATVLLEEIEALVALGDELFELRDARIALIVGVLHGLRVEGETEPARQTAVAAARAGYALRRAEEARAAVVVVDPLRELLGALERERADLLHWDAIQIAAWEAMEPSGLSGQVDPVDPRSLEGDPVRDEVVAELADAARESFGDVLGGLPPGDAVHAVRFGYGVRAAERSLPDDPSRLLRDEP